MFYNVSLGQSGGTLHREDDSEALHCIACALGFNLLNQIVHIFKFNFSNFSAH